MRRQVKVAFVVSVLAAVLPRAAAAQSPPEAKQTFDVGDFKLAPILQVRTRGEYRGWPVDMGGRELGAGTQPAPLDPYIEHAVAFMTRARLGLGAERGAIKAQVTIQDARAWGASQPTATLDPQGTSFGATGAYETYIEVHTTGAARQSFLRVGRQSLTWGDGRLIGAADVSPTARVLDGARGKWALGPLDIEGFAAFLDTPRPLGVGFADTRGGTSTWGAQLYGAQVGWPVDPLLKLEAMGLARVVSRGSFAGDGSIFGAARAEGETYTAAVRVSGDSKGFVYGLTGALQGGTVNVPKSATDATLRTRDRVAYAVAGTVAKTFDGIVASPTLQASGAFASGDDGVGIYKQFDPILPDVHVHHGALNVLALSNLLDFGGKLSVTPFKEAKLGVEYRYATLVNGRGEWLNGYLSAVGRPLSSGANAADNPGMRELGHEIDASFTWRPHPSLDLSAGYGAFLMLDAAKQTLALQRRGDVRPDGSVKPSDVTQMAWLSATVTVP